MAFAIDIELLKKEVIEESAKVLAMTHADLATINTKNASEFKMIIPLTDYILERIDTIKILIDANRMSDAYIISRSILEAFAKFLKIMNQDDNALHRQALKDFWVALSDVERMKDSDRAKKIINTDRLIDKDLYRSLIMTDEEIAMLKSKPSWGNRVYRNSLLTGWSFNGIFDNLIKSKKVSPLIPLDMIQQHYMVASHIVHGDAYYLSIVEYEKYYTDDMNQLSSILSYIKFLKIINELSMFLVIELSWHVRANQMNQLVVNRYTEYNKYIYDIQQPIVRELFRLEDELHRKP